MHAESRIRVLLRDDHVIVREGLRRDRRGRRFDVVATASDGQEGVEAALRLRPDVVVMDLVMPRLDGAEATRRIMAEAPEINVVVLTSFADNDHVLKAIDAGARGYILKDAPGPTSYARCGPQQPAERRWTRGPQASSSLGR